MQVGEMTEAEKEEWVKVTKEVQDRSEWFAALTYIGVLAKRSAGGKL